MKIEELKEILSKNVCFVAFTKKNGELREMICTTQLRNIPEEFRPQPNNVETYKENQIRVFDIEKQEWRSFLFENFISENHSTNSLLAGYV